MSACEAVQRSYVEVVARGCAAGAAVGILAVVTIGFAGIALVQGGIFDESRRCRVAGIASSSNCAGGTAFSTFNTACGSCYFTALDTSETFIRGRGAAGCTAWKTGDTGTLCTIVVEAVLAVITPSSNSTGGAVCSACEAALSIDI